MNRYPLWRYILIVLLIVLAVIYALPNVYGDDPAVQIKAPAGEKITLAVIQKIKSNLESQGITYLSAQFELPAYLIRFRSNADQMKAQNVIQASVPENYSVALNLAPKTPKWLLDLGAHPMKYGLDLRGGIHFLLAVDIDSMIKTTQVGDMHAMGQTLRDERIRYTRLMNLGNQGIMMTFANLPALQNAMSELSSKYPNYTFTSKVKGRFALIAVMGKDALVNLTNYAVDQNLNILRTRVNELGIAEPVIQRQGLNHISVDLPGIQDTARAKSIVGKIATVRFQMVDMEHDAQVAAQTGVIPFGSSLYRDESGRPILLKNQVVLKGSSIVSASSGFDQNGQPAVNIRVSGSDVSSFNQITTANVGKAMATVYIDTQPVKKIINGKVQTTYVQSEKIISVATIQSALGADFQIMGLRSLAYAQNLSLLLRSGAYSANVAFVQQRVVGPSLGKANIEMGIRSTIIGSIAIFIFMLFYYRGFGLIANTALILNIVFIMAILSLLQGTLTLAGIAAILLTVGMAVDANVLINERIREELRNGMSPQAAIYAGYARAFSTIVDANVTTLIVAVVLFALGTGEVQGFAVNLIIGLLTSMVTAIFFTRAIVNLVYGYRNPKQLSIGIKIK